MSESLFDFTAERGGFFPRRHPDCLTKGYHLTKALKDEIRQFAKDSNDNYENRGQSDKGLKQLQCAAGKTAEWTCYYLLKKHGESITEPDMKIYTPQEKKEDDQWKDPDLFLDVDGKELRVSVKSSLKEYGPGGTYVVNSFEDDEVVKFRRGKYLGTASRQRSYLINIGTDENLYNMKGKAGNDRSNPDLYFFADYYEDCRVAVPYAWVWTKHVDDMLVEPFYDGFYGIKVAVLQTLADRGIKELLNNEWSQNRF